VEAWGAPCIEWLASRQFASPQASSDEYIYDFFGADFFDAVATTASNTATAVSNSTPKQPVSTVKPTNDTSLLAVDKFVDPGDPPEDRSIKLLWPRGAVPGSKDANGSAVELISQVATTEAQEALGGVVGFAFERWPESFLWRGPHVPAIQVFEPAPELKTGASIIIAPGGGYSILPPHEGDAVAEWLADHGVTAILLRHRLIPYGYPIPTPAGDMQRAIRYVRHHAADLEIDPHRVGVLGISAGGHCASSVATMFDTDIFPPADAVDTESCRPDLCVLVYPLTSPAEFNGWVEKKVASFGSENADIEAQNTAMLVTADTPPTFIAHSTADMSLRVADHADPYWAALQANAVESEYVRTDFGAHGCGLVEAWGAPCIEWLASRQFASPQASSDEYIYDFFGADFFDAVAAQ
jgi:acetyl esterase/lipase